MERGVSNIKGTGLPRGYIHQHTLWTRRTFTAREDTRAWRGSRGMIIIMPEREEKQLHADFNRLYPERCGGLPQPSEELARLALAHLKAVDPYLGRKQQFESMTRYMRELARTSTVKEDTQEAKLFADHFARQLDFYCVALSAEDERDLNIWPTNYPKAG